jgi:glycosyltransferase involved in cell wall biosynthesis
MSVPVTLTLIAYNQENYVREAIESALAQTFSPLEIILSDDCSPDQTFAIMQEMVGSYRGPHRVHARREPVNVGTVQHLINVSRAAQGELVVIAAGDDLS